MEFMEQISIAATRDEDVEGPAEELDDGFACCGHWSWCKRVRCERQPRSEGAIIQNAITSPIMWYLDALRPIWKLMNKNATNIASPLLPYKRQRCLTINRNFYYSISMR
jgi:hypothetical protein